MKEKMLAMLMGFILERLDSEDLKKWADHGLDLLEDAIKKSENKFDDVMLPVIGQMRKAFSIPDND